jgi:hypothetical protein
VALVGKFSIYEYAHELSVCETVAGPQEASKETASVAPRRAPLKFLARAIRLLPRRRQLGRYAHKAFMTARS